MVPGLPEQAYVGNFINGLKDKIKRRLRVHDPHDLVRTMEIARDLEAELWGSPTQQIEGRLIQPPLSDPRPMGPSITNPRPTTNTNDIVRSAFTRKPETRPRAIAHNASTSNPFQNRVG